MKPKDLRIQKRKASRNQRSFREWLNDDRFVRRYELPEAVNRLILLHELRREYNKWYRRLWRWIKKSFTIERAGDGTTGEGGSESEDMGEEHAR